MSGVVWTDSKGQKLRFLTLTTAGKVPKTHAETTRDWAEFARRARREYGTFEFFKVVEFTRSGLEHLHVLFRGSYIPQGWTSDEWESIHGAKITFIEEVKGTRANVANYLVKYILKGEERYSWSKNWVYQGFVADWKKVLALTHTVKEAVRVWNAHLARLAVSGVPLTLEGDPSKQLWRREKYRTLRPEARLGIGWEERRGERIDCVVL